MLGREQAGTHQQQGQQQPPPQQQLQGPPPSAAAPSSLHPLWRLVCTLGGPGARPFYINPFTGLCCAVVRGSARGKRKNMK